MADIVSLSEEGRTLDASTAKTTQWIPAVGQVFDRRANLRRPYRCDDSEYFAAQTEAPVTATASKNLHQLSTLLDEDAVDAQIHDMYASASVFEVNRSLGESRTLEVLVYPAICSPTFRRTAPLGEALRICAGRES